MLEMQIRGLIGRVKNNEGEKKDPAWPAMTSYSGMEEWCPEKIHLLLQTFLVKLNNNNFFVKNHSLLKLYCQIFILLHSGIIVQYSLMVLNFF